MQGNERGLVRGATRRTRSPLGLLLAPVLVAALLAGCSSGTSSTDAGRAGGTEAPPPTVAPVRGGKLVVGTASEVNGLNPLSSQWSGPGYQVGRAILDPLVVLDRDSNWKPYLAKSITPNADFTVWTFELRPGIKFHNGEALDGDALKMFFDAATTSPLSSQGYPEKPVVTKTGPMTVTLTFTKPWSEMPTALVEQGGYVIAPEQLKSMDTKHPIGTGPFVFEEWVPDDHLKATRNPSYWREGLPYLDSIEFKPVTDPSSRQTSLKAGDLDLAELGSIGKPGVEDLRSAGLTVNQDIDKVGVTLLIMNLDKPPFDDLRVRQAVVAAIDRAAFRDTVLDSSYELADQPYPSGSKWHTDVSYPSFDAAKAKKLVDEYEAEKGPIKISILHIAARSSAAPQFIQQALETAGIEVQIDSVEQVKFVQRFVGGDYQMVFNDGFFGATDPDSHYVFLHSKSAAPETPIKLNFARYRNDEVDKALQDQRDTADEGKRREALGKIWSAFAKDLPYAFLAHDQQAWAYRAEIHGVEGFQTPEGVVLPSINRWTPFYTGVFIAQ